MKHVLLVVLLLTTLVSCSKSSSSAPKAQPPAGKDGVQELGNSNVKYMTPGDAVTASNINHGALAWEKGKDLLVVYSFHLGENLQGAFTLNELTIGKEAVKKLPAGTCPLQSLTHRWFVSRFGVDTPVVSGKEVSFDDMSLLHLEIESRSAPQCERVLYGFSVVGKGIQTKPQPTPVPTPTPTPKPTFPDGSESIVLVKPTLLENFNISYEGKDTNTFKYKVVMNVNGSEFGKDVVVEKVFVSVYDKVFKNYAAPWTEIAKVEPAGVLPGEYRLEFTLDQFSAPMFMISRQKELVLTFAINSNSNSPLPIRSLELDAYCSALPRSITEIETGTAGCK
ncbi:hypothetical protein [Bdellovibrio sp. HCB337]|uniref:hypothetical protein n=1 Tax=Bdellovibrio sp. HCB337 TaxID=3394358 RepID=UPI0039A60384